LATQLRKRSDGKIVKTPRAVKTLKSNIADETAKKMFLRECLIMVAVGKHQHVVSMVGVAVQQAPWLVVLPFLKSVPMKRLFLFPCLFVLLLVWLVWATPWVDQGLSTTEMSHSNG
jgi:hypothetical protein